MDKKDKAIVVQLPQQLTQAQISLLAQKTPTVFVKQRKGRGGQYFDYVEIGYVTDQLNQLFGTLGWDSESEIVSELTTPDFITVKVRLTVKDHKGHEVVKTAFGGVIRQKIKGTKEYVDIADDAKSAEADALKKAASKLGIAFDVYHPEIIKMKEFLATGKTNKKEYFCDRCEKFKKKTKITEEKAKQTYRDWGFQLCEACVMTGRQYMSQTTQVSHKPSNSPKQSIKTHSPKDNSIECFGCAEPITQVVANYSKRIYKKSLCRNCQKLQK